MGLDADAVIARTAREQHGLATRRQLRAAGIPDWIIDHRLRRGLIEIVQPAVFRLRSSPITPQQETLAAVLAVDGLAAASHQTAVWLWGIWDRQPRPTHITVRRNRWRPKSFTVHRSTDLYDDYVSLVDGIPVTTMTRTVVDLGATSRGAGTVTRVFDAALRLGLTTVDDVLEAVSDLARPGRTGVRVARLLAEERKGWISTTESELEDAFVRVVRDAGLPIPSPQAQIRDRNGVVVARVDFYYPRRRVAVELDGYRFHIDPSQFNRDRRRQNLLMTEDIVVLRYTARDLRERPEGVIAELAGALASR